MEDKYWGDTKRSWPESQIKIRAKPFPSDAELMGGSGEIKK